MAYTLGAVDAIVLAGGRGTRLQSVVSDVPKPLAPVNGRPFLDYQLELLHRSGQVRKVVLATGHLAHKIEEHYAEHPAPLPLEFVVEKELLGTGGGVANALDATSSARVLVLNGDSVFRWDFDVLGAALDALEDPRGGAALGVVTVADLSRYGGVEVEGGRVTAFHEKREGLGGGLINAGVYLFDRAVLETLPRGEVTSLEHQLFPVLAGQARLAAGVHDSDFIDIGLPQSYLAAATILPALTQP